VHTRGRCRSAREQGGQARLARGERRAASGESDAIAIELHFLEPSRTARECVSERCQCRRYKRGARMSRVGAEVLRAY